MRIQERTREIQMFSSSNHYQPSPPSSSTTESTRVLSTPPLSQIAGSSQAGESADKPGHLPTIIRDSLPVAFFR
ncbi:hypothetical protein LIER_06326 [Lithospermum erythrorhizon]|uniref:Uncharacterized protein n=1 Tax=Lithospermum erythrorhizon TaxID=34254 RepID=A0AAV3P7V5_LITER